MKKIVTFILAIMMISSLAACGEDKNTSSNNMSSEGLMSKIEDGVSSFIGGVESDISSMTSMMTGSETSISKEEALDIALKDAGVTKDSIRDYESELDRELGVLIYDIEFKSGDPTRHERKLEKLIADVIGKINDSDKTLTQMYEKSFGNVADRLKQRFSLVVDSKIMGITAITSTLATLSLTENPSINYKEKIAFEKILPELKQGVKEKDHYDRIDIWYSEFFEDYISNYNIRSSKR